MAFILLVGSCCMNKENLTSGWEFDLELGGKKPPKTLYSFLFFLYIYNIGR